MTRPRRRGGGGPYFSWMARRRTSLSIVVASCTTWKTSTARVACGSIRRTAEASTGHLSITAICTPWHQIGPAWGSQEAPVIGGAARELAPQARGTADIDKPGMPPVGEPGVPPVGEHHPGVGVGIAGEPGPAPAGLLNTQYPHRGQRDAQHRIGLVEEHLRGTQPGQPRPPPRPRPATPPLPHQVHRVLTQPTTHPRPGRDLVHYPGEPRPEAPEILTLPPVLEPHQIPRVPALEPIPKTGEHPLGHPPDPGPTLRAHRRLRVAGAHPHRDPPIDLPAPLDHPHTGHTQQDPDPILTHSTRNSPRSRSSHQTPDL